MSRPVAVLGVGNAQRGDDAVGCRVVAELAGFEGAALFDCETTPENFLAPVARLAPGRVLVIDACDFGGKPGEFRLFDRAGIAEISYGLLSTHTLPLHLFIELLAAETSAEISLLGVQPFSADFGSGLSSEVERALPALAAFVRDWVRSPGTD